MFVFEDKFCEELLWALLFVVNYKCLLAAQHLDQVHPLCEEGICGSNTPWRSKQPQVLQRNKWKHIAKTIASSHTCRMQQLGKHKEWAKWFCNCEDSPSSFSYDHHTPCRRGGWYHRCFRYVLVSLRKPKILYWSSFWLKESTAS